jgi:hypothetical protein
MAFICTDGVVPADASLPPTPSVFFILQEPRKARDVQTHDEEKTHRIGSRRR